MDFLLLAWFGKPLWMWLGFLAVIIALLVFDLGVLHRKDHEIAMRESLLLSAFYISLGLAFGGLIWWHLGAQAGQEYLIGFLIEKSLALDNIFVIALIFSYFGVPRLYQHRVLLWGVLGVLVLRGLMIGVGTVLIQNFAWTLYLFAVFLIYTGIRMWRDADKKFDVSTNAALRFVRSRFRVTDEFHGARFFIKLSEPDGVRSVWFATPLFLALVSVEFLDVVFAIDSVPAIFAITSDPFIVYTSNIFAILGLRALYFALAALVHRFLYLKHALAVLLVFIGAKIFIVDFAGLPGGKFPAAWSLAITLAILAAGVGFSLWKTRGS